MSASFSMHPELSQQMIDSMGYSSGHLNFSYTEGDEERALSFKDFIGSDENFTARLIDDKAMWYPEAYSLIVRKQLCFKNPGALFGPKGIAPSDAVLGIAEKWSAKQSKHCGMVPIGEIRKNDDSKKMSLELELPKGFIKGSVSFETVIYLKCPGKPNKSEIFLANQSGIILGVIDKCEVFIDGNSSFFPIVTVSKPDLPLWWIEFSKEVDPMQDLFEGENIVLCLNGAHPCYPQLLIETDPKESALLREVLSSALLLIINTVKENVGADWDDVLHGNDLPRGSIAEAIRYFSEKLEWDMDTPVGLSLSIHSFIDKNLKGGRR